MYSTCSLSDPQTHRLAPPNRGGGLIKVQHSLATLPSNDIHTIDARVRECRGSESWGHGVKSHRRQLLFLRKSDCLGCAVLLCLVVCITLLASFFLPSFLLHLSRQSLFQTASSGIQTHNTPHSRQSTLPAVHVRNRLASRYYL